MSLSDFLEKKPLGLCYKWSTIWLCELEAVFINLLSGPHFLLGFPGSSAGKESVCNAGYLGSIPGLGKSPGEGNSYPPRVLRPGEFGGWYSPWGLKQSDTAE